MAVIHWFNDNWNLPIFKRGLGPGLILAFSIIGALSDFLGASLFLKAPSDLLSGVLGLFLRSYVLLLYLRPSFKIVPTTTSAAAGGASAGFLAGIFGISEEITCTLLSAFDIPKASYTTTAGAVSLVVDSSRIVIYTSGRLRLEPLLL